MANEYRYNNKNILDSTNLDHPNKIVLPNFKVRGYPIEPAYLKTEDWQEGLKSPNFLDSYIDNEANYTKSAITTREYMIGLSSKNRTQYSNMDLNTNRHIYIFATPAGNICTIETKYVVNDNGNSTWQNILNDSPAFSDAQRVLLNIQAPGGGGGGSSKVYIVVGDTGGANGGSGGSGGFLSVILNLSVLREYPAEVNLSRGEYPIIKGNYFKITLGYCGRGVYGSTGWDFLAGATAGYDGSDGADCKLYFCDNLLFTVGGGKSGKHGNGYTDGEAGEAGTVKEEDSRYETFYHWYWKVPIYTNNNTYKATGYLSGLSGSTSGADGKATDKYKLRVYSKEFTSKYILTIGGYLGGAGVKTGVLGRSPGGAGSYFARGINGDSFPDTTYRYGVGGSGGKYDYNPWAIAESILVIGSFGLAAAGAAVFVLFAAGVALIAGGSNVDESIRPGSNGGPALVQIYY